jgi:predicted MFS family arabinose efflux permease
MDDLDRGLSRSGVLALAIAGFSTFIGLYATQPLLDHFEQVFRASKAEVGLTISAPTGAVAMFAMLVGVISDRTGRRRMIVGALAALAVVTGLAATAGGLHSLIVWRFVEGAGVAAAYVVTLAYLTEEAGPRSLGRALAALVVGNVIGGLSGRTIAGAVTELSGWRAAFLVLGGVRLAGAVAAGALLPASRRFVPRRTRGPSVRVLARGLGAPRLRATYIVGFCTLFSLVALFSYAGSYLSARPFSLGPGAIGALFMVYLVGAVVTPIAGRWVDRVGARRVLAWSCGAVSFGAAVTLIPSIVVVLVGLAIAASGAFVAQVASTSYLRTAAAPELRSLVSGAYVTWYYLGGSVAGVAPGLLWAHAGWGGTVALAVVAQTAALAISARSWHEPTVALRMTARAA